jgi:hypothetical protein
MMGRKRSGLQPIAEGIVHVGAGRGLLGNLVLRSRDIPDRSCSGRIIQELEPELEHLTVVLSIVKLPSQVLKPAALVEGERHF